MTFRGIARRLRNCSGQTLIESSLSIGIVVVMLIGIIEASIAVYDYNFVAYAARQGTRWAMVRGSSCTLLTDCNATTTQIQSYIQSLNYPMIQTANLTATTTWLSKSSTSPATWSTCSTSPCNAPGNEVQIQVTYPFTMNIPIIGNVSLNLHSTSSMVISQ